MSRFVIPRWLIADINRCQQARNDFHDLTLELQARLRESKRLAAETASLAASLSASLAARQESDRPT